MVVATRSRDRRKQERSGKQCWSHIPEYVVAGVMEHLRWETGASALFRSVCKGWQHSHDGLLPALRVRRSTVTTATTNAINAYTSVTTTTTTTIRFQHSYSCCWKRFSGIRTLSLRECEAVTNEALLSLSALTALTALDLKRCHQVTDEGVRSLARTALAARLVSLNLSHCGITKLSAISPFTGLTSLTLRSCICAVTDKGLRSLVSSLTALTSLDLRGC